MLYMIVWSMIEVYNTFTPHACKTLIDAFHADDTGHKMPGTTANNIQQDSLKKSTDLGCNFTNDQNLKIQNWTEIIMMLT